MLSADFWKLSDFMNINDIPQLLLAWVAVNIGATIVLAVLSYVSSVWVLDGLAALDRRMDASLHERVERLRLKKLENQERVS